MRLSQRVLRILFRLSRFWLHYGNPLTVLYKRHLVKEGMMTAIDRASGIACACRISSFQMFGEVWYNRDYDVPHFPIRPGDVVVDIGANQGFFACYAAHHQAKVYAFEPFPESLQTLKANLERNGLGDRVIAEPWAIGAREGTVKLFYGNDIGGGMNTTQPDFVQITQMDCQGNLEVPCYTLPQVIEKFGLERIRLCKLDCEGSELDILKQLGPEQLRRIDAFVLEYHPGYELADLMQLLLSWGTHQVSFAEDNDHYPRHVIRLVATQELMTNLS
ncbi:MAG: FkbM family methyltransferase [Leptolyngbyaceae cyanobacterium bins.59]|nr:FkbM family methyltransferase [Leptolyngbyaceae cyanobacterium bins.59]